MNEETWNRIKQIFHEAMARPLAERYAFLDEACSGDAAVRSEVEELLAAHDDIGEPITASSAASRTEAPGAIIGRYKLLQRIGEGGLGVVYMAEQEQPVRRRVALKIIKLGMDTKQVIARFEAERQALAMMEHPNIAKVLDAGTTETGRPYFVMELVKGVPMTEYCDSTRLSTRERLDLFMQLCSAVQHAHQKGIIHRDIKPSNVMVTLHDGNPVPKVIDFGIAKATNQRLTEKTLFTAYGQFMGTPVYMSPEQAEMSGLDVDTRSDIYSLGVLLYELLTGTTPFDMEALRKAGYGEIQRIIREEEPPTPSTRLSTLGGALGDIAKHRMTDPGGLTRLVRGDLDWIVMKALEKDRTRRYDSASAFAEDIARHLGNEPVVARPQSAAYKTKKFLRRHRGPVAAAAAIGATVLLLGSLIVWQSRVAQRRAEVIWMHSVLASASESDDPLLKAQLALELANLPEHPRRLALAREAADHRLPLAVLHGHTGVDVSPNGTRILTTTPDGTAWIWAADGSGEPIAVPGAGEWREVCWKFYCAARFSPDGRRVLAVRSDGTARLWRAEDGTETAVLREGDDTIWLAAFSPDGTHVVTTSERGSLRMWSIEDTQSSFVVGRQDDDVMAIVFSPDGSRLLVCYKDDPPRIWRVDGTGEHVVLPHGAQSPDLSHRVHRGTFTPDGSSVLTTDFGRTFRVFPVDGSEGPRVFRHEGLGGGEFSPDGTRFFSASSDGTVWIWSADFSGEPITLRGHDRRPGSIDFSPDGTRFVTASSDGTARLWRMDDPKRGSVVLARSPEWIFGARFTGDGTCVVTMTESEVRIWRADDTGEGVVFGTEFAGARLSVDGTRVVTTSQDGTLRVRPADGTGEPIVVGSLGGPGEASFSPDGTRVVGCSLRASIGSDATIWRLDGTEDPIVLRGQHKGCVASFTPDGSRVLTAGAEGTVKLWPADGAGEPVILAHEERSSPGMPVAGFTPDGSKVIILSSEDEVQLVSLDGTGEPTTLVQHEGVSHASFSPDGRWLATCSGSDNTAKVWRADGVGEPIVLGGHTAALITVVFSPDGKLVATAAVDGTARVWRADGRGEPLVLKGHGSMVFSAEFTPDGASLLTTGKGPPRLRRVTWPALRDYLREHTSPCLTQEDRIQYLVEPPDEARKAYVKCERRQGRSGAIM